MKAAAYVATMILAVHAAFGQAAPSLHKGSTPTIRSTSTLVIVPTVVRSTSGERVKNLDSSHFRLADNGIEQKVSVEQTKNEPLAVVVLEQTGGWRPPPTFRTIAISTPCSNIRWAVQPTRSLW